jgi:integrase
MMQNRKQLTKLAVERIEPQPGRDVFAWDSKIAGFGVRVTPAGKRSYIMQFRTKNRKQRRVVLGTHGGLTVEQARGMAADIYQQVRVGGDPVGEGRAERAEQQAAEEKRRTVADVLDQFMARHGKTLRSADQYADAFNRLVKPRIGATDIYALRRSQVAEMLDHIEDNNGARMADCALSYTRSALNWYASRDDDFIPPIAKRMSRSKPRERARTRVLDDGELRAVWEASASQGMFGAFVRVLLLTAQRRAEVAGMRRAEIRDGVWVIPAERYKTGRANAVPLSPAAWAIIEAQPAGELVFPQSSMVDSGKPKRRLDAAVAAGRGGEPLPNWTVHDLRRTAKTLMVRAGVRPDISERVLGHVIGGVEGVYDQHSYLAEKRAALEKLAALVARITGPQPEGVVVRMARGAG